MRIRYLFFIFFALLFSSTSIAQEIGYPVIRNYTPKEYNSSPQVFCAMQDKRDIMYFGTDHLIEYDGVSWRSISDKIKINPYDLAMNESGRIYVGAIDEFGYLTSDKQGITKYESLKNLLKDTTLKLEIIQSVKLTSKYVYFQAYNYVLQYSPLTGKITIFKAGTNGKFLGDFVYNDIYYIRLNSTGLMKIVNDKLVPAFQSAFFKNGNWFSEAIPFDTNTLLIPIRIKGLCLYKPNKDTIPLRFNISNSNFINDNIIYDATVVQNKYFVLGSVKQGALLLDKQGNTLQRYQESNLLQNNDIYKITTDKNQNLWFGLNNGISKTEHSQDLSYWDKNTGLKGIVEDVIRHNNIIYLATNVKVYYIDKDNKIQEVRGIPVGQNWSFLETENNESLLVGTQYGIYDIKGDKAVQIYKGSYATELYQSKTNPHRILSTDDELFISLKYENSKWVFEGKWEGIKDDVRGITEDENGVIWLGTYTNGVIRITPDYENITKPKKIRYYGGKDGFSSLNNILPFRFKNRIIWGTEKGLYIYNSQTDLFEPFHELGEQFCNGNRDVYSLMEMQDGKIWICPFENQKADIGYLQPNVNGSYAWVYAPFRRITDMFLEAFYIEPSGIAWIGGSEGIYRYDMSRDTKNYSQKFNCLIRNISAGADSIIYNGSAPDLMDSINRINLKYKFNSLKFEFAAPFFDLEEKTLYSYKLEGYDKAWSKWDRRTEKEYNNLGKGIYRLRVRARNIYDVVSETSTYRITILPPFYLSWWAYIIYFIFLSFFILIILKIYTSRLRRQKEHLEQIVKERTTEIVRQKEEILIQTKQLQYKNDKLLEMDEFKQGMTSMIVHDLKNPLNLILNSPNTIKPEKQIANMQQSGKQMLNMVLNILDVNKYEENAMKLELTEKQMLLIAINAIKQVQFLCDQKEIEIKNQIDQSLFVKVEEDIAERIMVNLLTNAIKFTPLNGSITLSSIPVNESFVRIEIRDTGEGIPEDKIHLVFQKFGQIVAKKSGGIRSTGLGLTFCKIAVEAHGGEIGLNSEVGKGTTFWFTLCKGESESAGIEPDIQIKEIKNEKYTFTEDEKIVLGPVIDRLKIFSIYETDDIEEIISGLKLSKSDNIKRWIYEVEKSISSLNQAKFSDLLKQCLP